MLLSLLVFALIKDIIRMRRKRECQLHECHKSYSLTCCHWQLNMMTESQNSENNILKEELHCEVVGGIFGRKLSSSNFHECPHLNYFFTRKFILRLRIVSKFQRPSQHPCLRLRPSAAHQRRPLHLPLSSATETTPMTPKHAVDWWAFGRREKSCVIKLMTNWQFFLPNL